MNKLKSLLPYFILLLFFLIPVSSLHAQVGSLGFSNIQNVQVDNLSDEQLLNFYRQMQANGFSVQEVGNIARARGMSPSEVSKLTARLNNISTGQDRGSDASGTTTSRTGTGADLQFGDPSSALPPIERELLISELRRLVSEREEEDVQRELDVVLEEGFPVVRSKLLGGAALSVFASLSIAALVVDVLGAGDEIRIDIW